MDYCRFVCCLFFFHSLSSKRMYPKSNRIGDNTNEKVWKTKSRSVCGKLAQFRCFLLCLHAIRYRDRCVCMGFFNIRWALAHGRSFVSRMTNPISNVHVKSRKNILFILTRLNAKWNWLQLYGLIRVLYYDCIKASSDDDDDDTHLRLGDFISHKTQGIRTITLYAFTQISTIVFDFSPVSNSNGIWYEVELFFFFYFTLLVKSNIFQPLNIYIHSVDNNFFPLFL